MRTAACEWSSIMTQTLHGGRPSRIIVTYPVLDKAAETLRAPRCDVRTCLAAGASSSSPRASAGSSVVPASPVAGSSLNATIASARACFRAAANSSNTVVLDKALFRNGVSLRNLYNYGFPLCNATKALLSTVHKRVNIAGDCNHPPRITISPSIMPAKAGAYAERRAMSATRDRKPITHQV